MRTLPAVCATLSLVVLAVGPTAAAREPMLAALAGVTVAAWRARRA